MRRQWLIAIGDHVVACVYFQGQREYTNQFRRYTLDKLFVYSASRIHWIGAIE
jgi:hypothetical protein